MLTFTLLFRSYHDANGIIAALQRMLSSVDSSVLPNFLELWYAKLVSASGRKFYAKFVIGIIWFPVLQNLNCITFILEE